MKRRAKVPPVASGASLGRALSWRSWSNFIAHNGGFHGDAAFNLETALLQDFADLGEQLFAESDGMMASHLPRVTASTGVEKST